MLWSRSKPLVIDLPVDEQWVYEKKFRKKGWEESYKRVMQLNPNNLTIKGITKQTGDLYKQMMPESQLENSSHEKINVSVRSVSETVVIVKSDCEIDGDGNFQYWLFQLDDERVGLLGDDLVPREFMTRNSCSQQQ